MRPMWRWQFANGAVSAPTTLKEMFDGLTRPDKQCNATVASPHVAQAWDRSLGCWVVYAT